GQPPRRDLAPLPTRRSSDLIGRLQQGFQALVGGFFAAYRRQADNAVVIDKTGQGLAALDPFALFSGQLHIGIQLCGPLVTEQTGDRKSTRLNSSHVKISYAV